MASELGVLDFLVPSLRFNVQSATQHHPFWTSSCLPSASTSNPPRLLIPFGLPRAFPPLQRPIRRACSSLLDFSIPSLCFNVQSAMLARPFWTSSCRPSASTSNLPRLLVPFGLSRAFPPLQRPIHRAFSSLLDFSIPSLRFNIQSTILARPFWTSAYLPSASTSNLPQLLVPFGLPRAFPLLQRPIRHTCPISQTPLWSIGKRERRSSRFLTPFFLWTRGESNPCPKTHSLFFYYHS